MTNQTRRCQINNWAKFYPKVESGSFQCQEDPTSKNFFFQNGNGVYSQRRLNLFNIYAFPDYMSNYKAIPSLTITNCNFDYFLGGYEALIAVENNNLQKINVVITTNTVATGVQSNTVPFYTYNGIDKGVKIMVTSSTFKISRFCKGMIVYRKPVYIPIS